MFVREYGLVHNPGDSDRFVRLVKWVGRWSKPDADGYESYSVTPTVWEWSMLDVSNPRAVDYSGPVWGLVPIVITELPARRGPSIWPSDAPTETESMRRLRIMEVRRACHVNEAVGNREPAWVTAARAARPQAHNPVCDVSVISGPANAAA